MKPWLPHECASIGAEPGSSWHRRRKSFPELIGAHSKRMAKLGPGIIPNAAPLSKTNSYASFLDELTGLCIMLSKNEERAVWIAATRRHSPLHAA